MADIRETIQKKYGIDIEEVHLLRLYKLDKRTELSQEETEAALREMEERWQQNRYSTNEKLAKRAEENVKTAAACRQILMDPELRAGLIRYYGEKTEEKAELDFPREFFRIVSATRKLKRDEISFFLKYFPEYKKQKKPVLEMLGKEFEVPGTELKEAEKELERAEAREAGGGDGKGEKQPEMVASLFRRDTLLKLRGFERLYGQTAKDAGAAARYPELQESLYAFLRMDRWKRPEEMSAYVEEQRAAASSLKYEGVQEAAAMMDLFNTAADLLKRKDIRCNFDSFKLLVKYPALTPYMYELLEPKESTVRALYQTADGHYGFRDEYDFILTYFAPLYEHFGIYDQRIKGLLKKAGKQAGKQKVLDTVDKALGRDKAERLPFLMQLVFFLAYLPLYGAFWAFELIQFIVWNLRYLGAAGTAAAAVYCGWRGLAAAGVRLGAGGLELKPAFENAYRFLAGNSAPLEGLTKEYEVIILLAGIAVYLIFLLIPAFCAATSLWNAATTLRKSYDWKGIERTFHTIFSQYKKRMRERMRAKRAAAAAGIAFAVLFNLIVIIGGARWIPGRINQLQWQFQITRNRWEARERLKEEQESWAAARGREEAAQAEEETQAEEERPGEVFEISVEAANIRSGPGTEYEAVAQAAGGERFTGTGRSEQSEENRRVWFEIYLDGSRTGTGWVSEKVAARPMD